MAKELKDILKPGSDLNQVVIVDADAREVKERIKEVQKESQRIAQLKLVDIDRMRSTVFQF